MQLLFLMTVALVLTTQSFACNYERIKRDPNYAKISRPKTTIGVPHPHGICVAPNGDFAVISYVSGGKIYLYRSCGMALKTIDLTKQHGFKQGTDCAFTSSHLFVVDYTGKKVFKLSMTGEFIKVFPGQFMHVTSCNNHLYFTTNTGGKNVAVWDNNGKEIRCFSVPAEHIRGIVVGIDSDLCISNGQGKQVYTYTTGGKEVGMKSYKEIKYADGLAMDKAGHLLIADHSGRKIAVYNKCGDLMKSIPVNSKQILDVEIGNDGTVLVADYTNNEILLF